MSDLLANYFFNKLLILVCIVFAIGMGSGILIGWYEISTSIEPLSLEQRIKHRAEELYIEFKAEEKALDRLEGEFK